MCMAVWLYECGYSKFGEILDGRGERVHSVSVL